MLHIGQVENNQNLPYHLLYKTQEVDIEGEREEKGKRGILMRVVGRRGKTLLEMAWE